MAKPYVAVRRIASFANNPTISAYHYRLFHGVCIDEHGKPTRVGNRWSEATRVPVSLIYNKHASPQVIQPSLRLLLGGKASQSLDALHVEGYALSPVRIVKVVNIAFK